MFNNTSVQLYNLPMQALEATHGPLLMPVVRSVFVFVCVVCVCVCVCMCMCVYVLVSQA